MFKHRHELKWAGAVATLAFLLSITGSTAAFAAGTSGTGGSSTFTTVSAASTSASTASSIPAGSPVSTDLGPLGLFGAGLSEQEAGSILQLVKGTMSSQDQATLDALLAGATAEQSALAAAQQQLDASWASINGLADEYLTSVDPSSALPTVLFRVSADWIFPVQGPHSFTDSFGAPRYAGGFHLHQGCDIMCAYGTPVVAVVSGVVTTAHRVDSGLGGIWVWLVGDDGNSYYYAHLSSIDVNIHAGTRVTAGQVLGYAGNTGDAKGGAVHLHFEWDFRLEALGD